jgi:hypothetical protein
MERRAFLEMMGVTGVGVALSPLSAISLEDDWYVNSRLGMSLRKPAGWHFVSVVDFEALMDEQEQALDEDRDLIRRMREVSEAPILTVNKYKPIPDDSVCPTIQVHAYPAEPYPLGVVDEAREACISLREFHRDFRLESEPAGEQVGGSEAAVANYTYAIGAGFSVRARVALVYGTRAHYSIGMAGPADGLDTSEQEFDAVWKLLKIL